MDSTELHANWEKVCAKVKSYEGIDASQINAFFSRLEPQAMSDGFLMLTADNDFIKTWIERHYLDAIKKALSDIYLTPFEVLVEVDHNQATQNTGSNPATKNTVPPEVATSAQTPPSEALNTAAIKIEGPQAAASPVEKPIERIVDGPASLTFSNFVIGDSNRMAYSMAVAVAEAPGKTHLNPLFIYGKSGLGKTHLMRAIQNYINENIPQFKAIYVDSSELLSDYMEAAVSHDKEKASYKNFKTRYEQADVLLIDDVQYFQGKKQTLDIVFQIFNKLIAQGKQIVLSADRAPKNIDIDERYQTRFNSGGTIDIQPPEIETKLGIVKGFVKECSESEGNPSLIISEDIQMYIADNSSSNIRELKSAVVKVIYQMEIEPNLGLEDVKALLKNHFSGASSKRLTIAEIQREVENFYKVSHSDLISSKRNRQIAYARQVAQYLIRQILDLPFDTIGKQFGGRDHTTVMYSVGILEKKMKENREVREEIEALKKIIGEISD